MLKKETYTWIRSGLPWFLAVLLWIIKTSVFYSQMGLAGQETAIVIAGTAILIGVTSFVGLFSRCAGKCLFVILYVIVGSLFMAVDSVYYAYVHKLPSMAQIVMVDHLGDIRDTIAKLVGWKQLLPLMDLPLWFLWFVNRRKKTERPAQRSKLPIAGLAVSAIGAAAVAFCGIFGTFRAEYLINELLCYHTYDTWNIVVSVNSDREVDKSLYTLKDDSDSPWFGIAEGRNVVILQIEALQNFVIGAEYNGVELTPNLNGLIGEDSLYFDRYYYQIGGGNTADAEFAVNNSLFAPHSEAAYVKYTDNDYHGLPFLLKDNGYSGAHVFHNYKKSYWNRETAYPYQGFDSYTALEDYEYLEPFPLGISDKEMFRQSMEQIKTYEEPFYAFYITVSSHHPYAIPEEYRTLTLNPEDEGTMFGDYMQAVHYADWAIGYFFDQMKEAGLYDNTIFVLYGDHYALTNTDEKIAEQVRKLTGRESYTIFDVFNVPCIMHIPGSGKTETVSVAGGHLDVLPTLLCLLGIGETQTVMFGQNLLTAEKGMVCQQTHLSIGSFISDDVFFSKPHNNILENYSVYIFGSMLHADPLLYDELSEMAAKKIEDCGILMANNDIKMNK
ncbi:MAG: LTA synthase family protein [Clostridia bacterium]|nr:LTA synthase family protein [Clostridia bacterium]